MTISNVVGTKTHGNLGLNDWWNEGWTDRTPKVASKNLIFKNSNIELNDWWGEGWEDVPPKK